MLLVAICTLFFDRNLFPKVFSFFSKVMVKPYSSATGCKCYSVVGAFPQKNPSGIETNDFSN